MRGGGEGLREGLPDLVELDEDALERWSAREMEEGASAEDFLSDGPGGLPFVVGSRGRDSATGGSEGGGGGKHWVEYCLFLHPDRQRCSGGGGDDPGTMAAATMRLLGNLRDSILGLRDEIFSDYIWHNEPFQLGVQGAKGAALGSASAVPAHLEGRTEVGDNLGDEWAIIYLLKEATRRSQVVWGGVPLFAHVRDSDGDPILIELACLIPPWLEPATSAWRVWIGDGDLHLLSEDGDNDQEGKAVAGGLSREEAIKRLGMTTSTTRVSGALQDAFQRRLDRYPKQLDLDLHRVRVLLPRKAAFFLKSFPQTISKAVHGYTYLSSGTLSSAAELRAAKEGATLGALGTEQAVELRVTMTKFLYAMLTHHQGPLWEESLADRLLESYSFSQARPQSEDLGAIDLAKAAKLGAALTMGLEVASAQSNDFGEEMRRFISRQEATIQSVDYSPVTEVDDGEQWLNVDPMELEEMLKNRYGEFFRVNKLDEGEEERDGVDEEEEEEEEDDDDDDDDESMQQDGSPDRPRRKQVVTKREDLKAERDLKNLVDGMSSFIEDMRSGLDGVEIGGSAPGFTSTAEVDDLNFDADRFIEMLGGGCEMESSDSDDSSASSKGRDRRARANATRGNEENDNSDDAKGDAAFLEHYFAVMQEELDEHKGTAESFERIKIDARVQLARAKAAGPLQFDSDHDRAPDSDDESGDDIVMGSSSVDVDLTLLKNLLESYESQGGNAGPASTLLRELGLGVPASWQQQQQQQQQQRRTEENSKL